MNLNFEANKIKDICETKQGNERIIELCKIIKEIHTKGKHVGYETAVKEIDLRVKNALDMKDEYIS